MAQVDKAALDKVVKDEMTRQGLARAVIAVDIVVPEIAPDWSEQLLGSPACNDPNCANLICIAARKAKEAKAAKPSAMEQIRQTLGMVGAVYSDDQVAGRVRNVLDERDRLRKLWRTIKEAGKGLPT